MPKKKSKPRKTSYKKYFYVFTILAIVIFGALLFMSRQNSDCANSISCIKDLSGAFNPEEKTGEFMGKAVRVPDEMIENTTGRAVLGETSSNKRIFVDLANQKLYAKEGDRTVYEFPISSGKWGRTPTGNFNIWVKLNATRMRGGSRDLGTYYDLPNVQWTMFFFNREIPKSRGYAIHGAYWHNNFGHPMSHGCINMRTEDAKVIYDWADPVSTGYTTYASLKNPGTPITIFGVAPAN